MLVDFDQVYEQFKLPVWRLARRLTKSDDEALDTTQEIFLRVWRGLPGFRGEAKISTWVFQIAWNYLRAHRRRMGRNLQFISKGTGGDRELAMIARDPQADPERRAASVELLDRVEDALSEAIVDGQLRPGQAARFGAKAGKLHLRITDQTKRVEVATVGKD